MSRMDVVDNFTPGYAHEPVSIAVLKPESM